MSDLIDRQAAITLPIMPKEYRKHKPIDCDDAYEQGWSDCQSCIGRLPTAEKRGKWIPQDHNYKHGNISTCLYFAPVCSECGNSGDFKMNYCPNCGARMEEENNEGDNT